MDIKKYLPIYENRNDDPEKFGYLAAVVGLGSLVLAVAVENIQHFFNGLDSDLK